MEGKGIGLDELKAYINQKLDEHEASMLDKICGVGEVLMTTREGNPSTWLGRGTWEQLPEGLVPISAGATYLVGQQYGQGTVTLTKEQMPAHNHGGATGTDGSHEHTIETLVGTSGANNLWSYNAVAGRNNDNAKNKIYPAFVETGNHSSSPYYNTYDSYTDDIWGENTPWNKADEAGAHGHTINSEGSGNPIDIHQPSIAYYFWRRTA